MQEKLNLLEEVVRDDLERMDTSEDRDARTGHKTADTSFFGYKTHIAMTEERIITAATITSGEKTDGKELESLVQKSKETGMEIETVIGDKAYSSKKNIEAAKEGHYELVARLNSIVTQGNRTKPDDFEFNKDAGMYQCKAGYLAVHKYLDKRKSEGKNPRMTYFYDIEKCKRCPYRDGCYKEGAKKRLIQRLSSVIPKANRHNFKKRNVSKKRQKSVISMKAGLELPLYDAFHKINELRTIRRNVGA